MPMTLEVDLHRTARSVNIALLILVPVSFCAGLFISFYFHFLTVAMLFLNVINGFYLFVQKRHTLLRNFGVLAQARYFLESIGPEMRQYLFASDTEERPFNRQERAEVYRKAYNVDSASSFGSQNEFDAHELKIRHSMFPMHAEDIEPFRVVFGEERKLNTAFAIDKPIMISAMSFGALGQHAVRALARGARSAGIPMNTGEGGFPKYHLMEGCNLIFQMGTAKFGVRNENGSLDDDKLREVASHESVRMIEVKLSQGAKPGKGGLLPKEKISEEISQLRGVPRDRDVVSPPGHVECTDAAATVRFIGHVQQVAGLPTGIKLCLGHVTEFRALVEEMKLQQTLPDWITVDGAEGGTGAAPKSFLDGVGIPLWPALHTVHQTLIQAGVRDRLKLLASGKLINAGRLVTAMALGADACYSARGFMLSLGCIQALQCGRNTCPIGITTHDPELQRGLDIDSKSQRVANFVHNLTHDFEQLQAATGKRSHSDLSAQDLYIPEGSILHHEVHTHV
jgi:glutamate synthase domain-containing protein 2